MSQADECCLELESQWDSDEMAFPYVLCEHALKAMSQRSHMRILSHPTVDGVRGRSSPQVAGLSDSTFSACKSWGGCYKTKIHYFRVIE